MAAKRVPDTSVREVISTTVLTFADGSRIETTSEHPFFVSGLGWVPAGRLAIGNAIVTRAGPKATEQTSAVAKVETLVGRIRVYNLNVADNHTFFVQDAHGNGLPKWVHNGCIWKISPVFPDWAVKGAHFTANGIELALRPGRGGAMVLKQVFSKTPAHLVREAIQDARPLLQDKAFLLKMLDRVKEAKSYVLEYPKEGGMGRSAELHFLEVALKRALNGL
ncbi:MAG: polymorphic toxin-type HINT domain-containing protein [Capsulimonadales bacterium]|nr:polymorphic toxin-type HINT domain-containing protein [Capsulimonadales bacterium]